MDPSTIIMHLAIMLMLARLMGEAAARLNMPSVIGELAAGVLLGPSLFGLIDPGGMIRVVAEIGIILLLFEIGLETDIGELTKAGRQSVIVAVGGFILPFVLCFGLSYYWFELETQVSLLIAGTMTATSIGITMRTLSDLGRGKRKEGQIVLGAAVLDDILGVLLLAFLLDFATSGTFSLTSASKILLYMLVFFFTAPTLAKVISNFLFRFEPNSLIPGIIPTTIVALVLFLAWISHAIGIPELLGGFATGLALSRRFFIPFGVALRAEPEFSDHIHTQMKPIIQLFTPMFFVSVGLTLDLSTIDWSSQFFWYFSISLTALAVLSKMAAALLIKESFLCKIAIGMSMVPRGEVGLIFAELGRISGIFSNEIYATLVITVAYTTLFTPFWLRLFYKRYGSRLDRSEEPD